ncbi:MAG: hypothetical protein EOO07_36430 [Chitinophagaceae bacterium]|nr:MAG: hypothetical protein EOO07_36430 [Chitinophagaceae bacterium]
MTEDKSGFSEPILAEVDYRFIDSLTTVEKNFLKADSIKNLGKAEGSDGKHVLDFLIRKIENGEVNKIAKNRYRRAKKN